MIDSRRLIHWLGILIVTASFCLILYRFWETKDVLADWRLKKNVVLTTAICATLYGMSEFLLSIAWRFLLDWCGHPSIPFRTCHGIYGKTQIAKYLPGNIFHFAGRQVLSRSLGISHFVLAGSTIYEILGVIGAASLLGFFGMAAFAVPSGVMPPSTMAGIVFVVFTAIIISVILVPKIAAARNLEITTSGTNHPIKALVTAYILYIAFFVSYGTIFILILLAMVETNLQGVENLGYAVTILYLAWVAGYVTPGAPGGIGIREAVLATGMNPVLGEAEGLIIALLLRVVTVIGDAVFFMATYWLIPTTRFN